MRGEEKQLRGETEFYSHPKGDSIHTILNQILDGKKVSLFQNLPDFKKPRIIYILGSPGQGKSSLTKKLLADYLKDPLTVKRPIYYIPLKSMHLESITTDPIDVFKEKYLKKNLIEPLNADIDSDRFKESILILDGLDELIQMYNMNDSDIQQFTTALNNHIKEFYQGMTIIITCRLGYLKTEEIDNTRSLVMQILPFNEDEQTQWQSQYKIITKEELPFDARNPDSNQFIGELISQPLLLHLLTSQQIKLDKENTRASVYQEIITKIVHRAYSEDEQIDALTGVSKEDLHDLLRALAWKIFTGGRDYICAHELEEIDEFDAFKEKTESKNLNKALRALKISFYFQDVQRTQDDRILIHQEAQALEFLHKSFAEFLAAEYLWKEIKKIVKGILLKLVDSSQAQEKILKLLSPRLLTPEIRNYLEGITQSCEEEKDSLKVRLKSLFPELLKTQFYSTSEKHIERSLTCFENYLFFYQFSHTGELQPILEENSEWLSSLVFFMKSLIGLRQFQGISYLSLQILPPSVYSDVIQEKYDLTLANLRGLSLPNIILSGVYMLGADLNSSTLSKARLGGATLRGATLKGATLKGATLNGATLVRAHLEGAHLEGAHLEGARMEGAHLEGVKFYNTDLYMITFNKETKNR